jgi:hypothetical protein
MASITEYRHKVFLHRLDNSIKQIEDKNAEDIYSQMIIMSLKKEKDMLQNFYEECNNKTEQLKKLITDYKLIQRKTQGEMRKCRQWFNKKNN